MASEMKFVFRMGNELNWLRSKIPLKMTVEQPSIEQLDRNVTCTRGPIYRLKAKPYVSFVSINRHLIRLICYTMHMRFKCFSAHRVEYQSQFFKKKKCLPFQCWLGAFHFRNFSIYISHESPGKRRWQFQANNVRQVQDLFDFMFRSRVHFHVLI